MNSLVRRGVGPGVDCASESMDHFTFGFVKEQKLRQMKNTHRAHQNIRSVEKLSLEKWEGEKPVTQRKVMRTWNAFKRSQIIRDKRFLTRGTASSVNSNAALAYIRHEL